MKACLARGSFIKHWCQNGSRCWPCAGAGAVFRISEVGNQCFQSHSNRTFSERRECSCSDVKVEDPSYSDLFPPVFDTTSTWRCWGEDDPYILHSRPNHMRQHASVWPCPFENQSSLHLSSPDTHLGIYSTPIIPRSPFLLRNITFNQMFYFAREETELSTTPLFVQIFEALRIG